MTLRRSILESALLVLAMLAVVIIFESSGTARSLASVLLIFVLPGRAFLAAWFPHRLADAPGNFLLILMLSIAIAVIGGLLLNVLPFGLQAQTWALWLSGTTVFNETIVLLRSAHRSETVSLPQGLGIRPGQALAILLAGLVVVGSIMVARSGALSQPRPGFTQLWMLQGDTSDSAQIGVQNEEGIPMSYWLIVEQGTTPINAYYDIQIAANGTWNTTVQLPTLTGSVQQPIEAQLYRVDQPNGVYRSASLWVSEAYPK